MNTLSPHRAMRCSTRLILAVLTLLLRSLLLRPMFACADTPVTGDCWRSGQPLWCTWNWQGPNQFVNFKLIDNFSAQEPSWYSWVDDGRTKWDFGPGPQSFYWTDVPNNVYDYQVYASSGEHGLTGDTNAITWMCRRDGSCVDTFTPLQEQFAVVYLNHDTLDLRAADQNCITVAHELGHTLGLKHHNPNDPHPSIMNPVATQDASTPQGDDIGNATPCSSQYPPSGGDRCVFDSFGRK